MSGQCSEKQIRLAYAAACVRVARWWLDIDETGDPDQLVKSVFAAGRELDHARRELWAGRP